MAKISVNWTNVKVSKLLRCSSCGGSLSTKNMIYKTRDGKREFEAIKSCSFCSLYYIHVSMKPYMNSIVGITSELPSSKKKQTTSKESSVANKSIRNKTKIIWYEKQPIHCLCCSSKLISEMIRINDDADKHNACFGSKCKTCNIVYLSKKFLEFEEALKDTYNLVQGDEKEYYLQGVVDCYVYKGACPQYCVCDTSMYQNSKELQPESIVIKSKKGNILKSEQKRCPSCRSFYITKNIYNKNKDIFHLIERIATDNEDSDIKAEKQAMKIAPKEGGRSNSIAPMKDDISKIGIKDFVVRSNIYRCIKSNHEIINIDATVKVVDHTGNQKEVKVPAGYCRQCNTFFIMEHTFQYLKSFGIILCRITDNKTYMATKVNSSRMQMAQESVLMQYGYNVSSTKDLSEKTRRAILAVLVDYKVLSKSEITSYINSFIRLRKNNPTMKTAVQKWVGDRDFISSYRVGSYSVYGIKSLTR